MQIFPAFLTLPADGKYSFFLLLWFSYFPHSFQTPKDICIWYEFNRKTNNGDSMQIPLEKDFFFYFAKFNWNKIVLQKILLIFFHLQKSLQIDWFIYIFFLTAVLFVYKFLVSIKVPICCKLIHKTICMYCRHFRLQQHSGELWQIKKSSVFVAGFAYRWPFHKATFFGINVAP